MANVAGPFGALQWGTVNGGPPNFMSFGNPPYRIAAGNTGAIGFGDLVELVGGSAPTGFVTRWTAGDGATASKIPLGIFYGCQYLSTGQRKTVWNNFWPGSDATGDVQAFICADPNAIFLIQATTAATPFDQTYVGMNADVVMGSVNTTTGASAMGLALPTTTITLPFKVLGPVTAPPTVNGTDATTAFNNVLVTWNNQIFKSLFSVHS
jgi:hypothetical protein